MAELLALEWLPDRISVLSADGRSAQLETVDHVDPLISAVQIGETVRSWLRQQNVNADKVSVVLPRESVVVRRLHLPSCPENELPDLVRFQAATRTSAPIDKLALDYLPVRSTATSEGQDVMTVTFDRDRLTRIESVCNAAGLELTKVTFSGVEIGRLIRSYRAMDLGTTGADLVLYQQGARFELTIFDEGTLVFCHAVQLPGELTAESLKPLNTELTRSLVSLSQARPNATILRCFYVSGHPNTAVTEALAQKYGAGLTVVDSVRVGQMQVPAGFESLAGVFLADSDLHLKLDLLHPREKYEAPDRRKLYLALSVAAVLLCVIVGGSIYYSQQSRLQSDVFALQAEVEKQKEQLNTGRPRLLAYEKVAQWKSGDTAPIQLWASFRDNLPTTDRVYFTEIKVSPSTGETLARFTGKGQARDRTDIDALNQSLSDRGYRVRPTIPILGKRDPAYPWQFDLDVELQRPRRPVIQPVKILGTTK